jgi:hypothetical protein
LGKANGRVGNAVIRDFGYDSFISVRPKRYKIKKNFKDVSHKLHFYYSMQFAKWVFNYPDFKEVWNKSNMPGKRGYNRMITANIELLKDNLPSTDNILTPKGRALLLDITELNNKGLKFSFGMAGLIKPPFFLTIVIMLFNPIESDLGLNKIEGARLYFTPKSAEKIKNKKENGKYDYKYAFNQMTKFYMTHFRNMILYATVVGTPTIKGKAWWTSTVGIDISKLNINC